METLTSMKDNSTKQKIDLLSMSIKRNNSSGITLKIKSQKFADFFKNNTTREESLNSMVKINGLNVPLRLKNHGLSRTCPNYYQFAELTTNNLKNSDGLVNLAFLLESRIAAGVEFEIYGRYSVEAMNDFKTSFKTEVTKFYIENMQKVKIDLDMAVME
jgi:hypothetical protein